MSVASPEHTIQILVSEEDIDQLGHVSNLVYLAWVLHVAEEHTGAIGFDLNAFMRMGAAFVVRKHEIEYLRPAFAGDAVHLTTWVESWMGATSIRRTSIRRAADGVVLATATTQWAWVSFETGQPQRIPLEIIDRFAAM